MKISNFQTAGVAMLLASVLGSASAQPAHPALKHAFELPPSADLTYDLAARQRGLALKGEALVTWRAADGKYSTRLESRVSILGTLSDDRSEGTVDAYGLAPGQFWEKRMRKEPTTVTFDRDSNTIRFEDGDQTYPLKGGEQDRVSVTWQLAAVARAAGDKFKPGSEWPFFVAGRRDAETWTFKVVKREKIKTGVGEVEAVMVSRKPLKDSREQAIDVWLAPSQEWYPVKIRFTEGDKETIEQTLRSITKK